MKDEKKLLLCFIASVGICWNLLKFDNSFKITVSMITVTVIASLFWYALFAKGVKSPVNDLLEIKL
jgi:hypothetical protein